MKKVVRNYLRCQCTDCAHITHISDEVSNDSNWKRLAVDVTHYRQLPYLSILDCGPGWFAIWRELRREDATEVAGILEDILLEREPVDEILIKNSTFFQPETLKQLLTKLNLSRVFKRCIQARWKWYCWTAS